MMHTSDNKFSILVIEDDDPKLAAISNLFPKNEDILLTVSSSLSSSLSAIESQKFDFYIIDMSLPEFDIKKVNSPGIPQDFGGRDILRFIEDTHDNSKAIILTQYSEFFSVNSQILSFNDIKNELLQEFESLLIDVIFYSGQRGEWRDKVLSIFSRLFNEKQ